MKLNNVSEFDRQWVCLQCVYNMIGEMPHVCPFCGADQERFMAWDKVEKCYRVTSYAVNDTVSQLRSIPHLGLEHAAYRIETETGPVWIDSPSAFNRDLPKVKAILFTHHHFLGACNQYRRLWNSEIWIHASDAEHELVASFDIDLRFKGDFSAYGIEAFHIGGHTPGFTCYLFRDVLFICDYVFLTDDGIDFNPFGPKLETRKRALHLYEHIKDRNLNKVCGFNYVVDFSDWMPDFERFVNRNG